MPLAIGRDDVASLSNPLAAGGGDVADAASFAGALLDRNTTPAGLDPDRLALDFAGHGSALDPALASATRHALEDRLSPADLSRFSETLRSAQEPSGRPAPDEVAQTGGALALGARATVGWSQLGVDAATAGRLLPSLASAAPEAGLAGRLGALGAVWLGATSFAPAPVTKDLGGGLSVTLYGAGTTDGQGRSAVFTQRDAHGSHVLDVPAAVSEQGLSFSPERLRQATGRPLPEALDGAVVERNDGLPRPLYTYPARARAAVGVQNQPDMRAHHLVPVETIRTMPAAAQAALARSGFGTDEPQNVMALPGDEKTQAALSDAMGFQLPLQRGPHPRYNRDAGSLLRSNLDRSRASTPEEVRHVVEDTATQMRLTIRAGLYNPKLP